MKALLWEIKNRAINLSRLQPMKQKKKHKLQVKIFNKKIEVELSINLFFIKQNKVI